MNGDIEPVLSALLSTVAAKVAVSFTATCSAGSAHLSAVSSFTGLFVGIGIFGNGAPINTSISAMDANAGTITLSNLVEVDGTAAAFKGGFLTTGRRVPYWKDSENQPALYLRHHADEDEFQGNLSVTTVEAEWWIYSRAGEDPDFAPDIALNNLVRAVRDAMAPDDSMQWRFTIGGRCHWCRIEGRQEYDDGTLDKQSKAVLNVKITLP